MFRKAIPILLLVALLSAALFGCQSTEVASPDDTVDNTTVALGGTLANIKAEGVLRVGIAPTTPGAYKDVNTGQWTGINIDVTNELAKFMGVELEIIETSWDLFLPALNSGEFDIYMPGTFYTGKRALEAAYSAPAYYKGVSAIVRADDDRYTSIEDFNSPDVRIAVRLGAVEAELAPKFFPEAEIIEFKTDEAPTIGEAVKVGNADVWLADEVLQAGYLKENDWAKLIGEPFGKYPIGYVVRYGDYDWLNYVDRFVDFMRSSGQMRIYVERHGQNGSTLNAEP